MVPSNLRLGFDRRSTMNRGLCFQDPHSRRKACGYPCAEKIRHEKGLLGSHLCHLVGSVRRSPPPLLDQSRTIRLPFTSTKTTRCKENHQVLSQEVA